MTLRFYIISRLSDLVKQDEYCNTGTRNVFWQSGEGYVPSVRMTCVVLSCVVLCCVVLCCVALCCVMLCCVVLCCVILDRNTKLCMYLSIYLFIFFLIYLFYFIGESCDEVKIYLFIHSFFLLFYFVMLRVSRNEVKIRLK